MPWILEFEYVSLVHVTVMIEDGCVDIQLCEVSNVLLSQQSHCQQLATQMCCNGINYKLFTNNNRSCTCISNHMWMESYPQNFFFDYLVRSTTLCGSKSIILT